MISPCILLVFDGSVWRKISEHKTLKDLKIAANARRDKEPGVELAWTDDQGGLSGIHLRKSDRGYGVPPRPRAAPLVL